MPLPFLVKSAKGLRYGNFKDANFVAKIFHFVMMRKAGFVWGRIGNHIRGKSVLDIGMGCGSIIYFLRKKGFEVKSVDVANLSIYDDLEPIIYDGTKIPFKNNSFESAVIIHVLHHCIDGLAVLREAKRVSKRVIFIEDTYRNWLEWFVVSVSDALNNGEFWFHEYRTISEWERILKKNKWKIVRKEEWSEWGVAAVYGRYCMFVIE